MVDERNHGSGCVQALARVSGEGLLGNFLAFQHGQGAGLDEEVRHPQCLGVIADADITQVKQYLLGVGLTHVLQLGLNLLDVLAVEATRLDVQDAGALVEHLACGRNGGIAACDLHLLRRGMPGANDGQAHRRSGCAFQQHLQGGKRHVAGALIANGFDEVAVVQVRAIGRAAGNCGNHCRVAEALGHVQADLSPAVSARLVGLVLLGREIARRRIHTLKQATQRRIGYLAHVGVHDVVALDVPQHLAVYLHLAIRSLLRIAGGAHAVRICAQEHGQQQNGGQGEQRKFERLRHRQSEPRGVTNGPA